MKSFSYEVALYLYKSTIRLCIEFCFHASVAAPSYYLYLLDKLEKRLWRTNYAGPDMLDMLTRFAGPSLGASLESVDRFPVCFDIFVLFFHVTPCLVIAVHEFTNLMNK